MAGNYAYPDYLVKAQTQPAGEPRGVVFKHGALRTRGFFYGSRFMIRWRVGRSPLVELGRRL